MMMGTMTEHPLADMVQQAHDAGLSYREMSTRAQRGGHEISHTQLSDYAQRKVVKAPTERMLRALAAALDTGYDQVREAMFQEFYGYVPRELRQREYRRLMAALPPNMSTEDEENLAQMVELWLRSQGRG